MDPRLFPRSVRWPALLTVNVFVFLGNMYSSGIATGFNDLGADFHLPYQKLSNVITYSVLSMGLANLFWMPLALCFGKRPIVLISMLMFVGGCIWTIVAKDYDSLIGARVFASFGYGSIESLGPSILADIFSEKDYSTAMAIYALFLSGGSQIGPVIAGYLVSARGWRWFFILCLIVGAVNFVTTFFLLPETLYEPEEQEDIVPDPEMKDGHDHVEAVLQRQAFAETFSYSAYWKNLFKVGVSKEARKRGILKHLLYLFWMPFPMLLVPGVLIASMMYGVVLGGVVSISTLAPTLLGQPPYNFSSPALGLFVLSSFIGVIVTFPIAGPLTDALSRFLRHRSSSGVHKPEHRLPALIVPFLIAPPGLVLFGYGIAHKMHYVAPAAGAAMAASGLTSVPSVMLSYVVDSVSDNGAGGEALVLVNASKNVVAFGLAISSVQWMAMEGVDGMFYEFAGVMWAVLLLGLPLYFLGPWIRRRMARFF